MDYVSTMMVEHSIKPIPSECARLNVGEDDISTNLTYMTRDPVHQDEKPYTVNYDTQGILPRTNISNEAHPVVIRNFRQFQTPRSFEDYGFTSAEFDCTIHGDDFNDNAIVEQQYYPAVRKLLWSMFPDATDIRILEHSLRKRHVDFPVNTGNPYDFFQPATLTHTDFTPESATRTAQAAFQRGPESYTRLLTVNFWKHFSGPGNDWPLALCDARTVDRENDTTIMADVVYADRFTENERLFYEDGYQWYWFKDLKDNELIIFRQSDSSIKGGGGVLHSSFWNPHAGKDARPRESIELRAFLFWQ